MKMRKIIAMGLAALVAISAMSVSAFAVEAQETVNEETEIVADGPVGTEYDLGDVI